MEYTKKGKQGIEKMNKDIIIFIKIRANGKGKEKFWEIFTYMEYKCQEVSVAGVV